MDLNVHPTNNCAASLGICDHVRFLGKQDAWKKFFLFLILFLMPSESESFGLAALEAMACKVPAITSNAGGLPELNIDGYLWLHE